MSAAILRKSFLAAACVAVVAATACDRGGEQESAPATEQTTTTTTAETTTAASPAPAPGSPAPAGAPQITIEGMRFGDPITVAPGAQITVVNDDSAEHSVTSDAAGTFDVHVDGKQQGTLTAPAAPGTYPFYCIYHPSMRGELIVQ